MIILRPKFEEIHVRFSKIRIRFPKYWSRPATCKNLSSELLLSSKNEQNEKNHQTGPGLVINLILLGTVILNRRREPKIEASPHFWRSKINTGHSFLERFWQFHHWPEFEDFELRNGENLYSDLINWRVTQIKGHIQCLFLTFKSGGKSLDFWLPAAFGGRFKHEMLKLPYKKVGGTRRPQK